MFKSITYGTYQIKTYDDLYKGLDMAFKEGIRNFDTAELYQNHDFFGKIINDLLIKYNLKRKDIWITTKISSSTLRPSFSDENIRSNIDAIFKMLDIEYIDLLLIHKPTTELNNYRLWDILTKYDKINHIGVSNFDYIKIKQLNDHIAENNLKPIYCNQIELNPLVFSKQLLLINYCKENQINISLYGLFYHFYKYNEFGMIIKRNQLIKWAIHHNFTPIIKTLNEWNLQQCLMDNILDEHDIDKLNNINFNSLYGFIYTKFNSNK
jgi:diketogulonate reductase-like aldo/keto reductase